jgi:hypothetical protein
MVFLNGFGGFNGEVSLCGLRQKENGVRKNTFSEFLICDGKRNLIGGIS